MANLDTLTCKSCHWYRVQPVDLAAWCAKDRPWLEPCEYYQYEPGSDVAEDSEVI